MSLARRLLRTPGRILARMRSLDDVLDYTPSPSASGFSSMHPDPNARAQRMKEAGAVPIPGPWGFLTSGYFFGLFFMAFMLNRVQNIVVPPRQAPVFQQYLRAATASQQQSRVQSVFRMLFPMDLSSTRTSSKPSIA
ncbi:hypothetical protein EIP86_010592 [Pleurotus ostreatoroseus]|nr:hypothetical protein EIP86_010592 [Pleurotus ostreatoroseus]